MLLLASSTSSFARASLRSWSAGACSGCTRPPTAPSWRAAWPITYSSRTFLISCGRGSLSRVRSARSSSSSRMMSLQSSTHSSQTNTDGPAMSLRTSCWFLPQKRAVQKLAVVVFAAGIVGHALPSKAGTNQPLSNRRPSALRNRVTVATLLRPGLACARHQAAKTHSTLVRPLAGFAPSRGGKSPTDAVVSALHEAVRAGLQWA